MEGGGRRRKMANQNMPFLSTYFCQVSAQEASEGGVLSFYAQEWFTYFMCDKAPGCCSRGIPLLFPEKRMSQWIQPQPESLHTNIWVMRHTRIKPSGCPPMFCFFLASCRAEVNAGGSGVPKLTLRPQSHTHECHPRPASRSPCERTVSSAWLQALCGEAISGQHGPASGWQGHETP